MNKTCNEKCPMNPFCVHYTKLLDSVEKILFEKKDELYSSISPRIIKEESNPVLVPPKQILSIPADIWSARREWMPKTPLIITIACHPSTLVYSDVWTAYRVVRDLILNVGLWIMLRLWTVSLVCVLANQNIQE